VRALARMGKLSSEELKKLLRCIKKDPRVIVPPTPGYDSGVHLLRNKYVVVSTDPCIGVPKSWFGWLLIHYAASDVALFGARPEFGTINLLGPTSTKARTFQEIMHSACNAADELGMAIVTGHTGTYEGLSTIIGVCTAYGAIDQKKLITPGGAMPGDKIFCVKPMGMETIVNLSLTQKQLSRRLFGEKRTQELATLVPMQSCVKEALLLASFKGVHAMHDATEGGLTEALNEISEASNVGFETEFEKMPIMNETSVLKKHFRLSDNQVLSMSSTGTILAAVDAQAESNAKEALIQNKVESRIIGVFTAKGERRILQKNGKETGFPRKANDPYMRILSGKA